MNIRSRPAIAIVVVMALALAGGGAAFAVTKSRTKTQDNNSTQQQCGPGGLFRHGTGGPGGAGPAGAGFFDAAAGYLGLTNAQLMSRIADGQTLADIAKAQGKSVDGLKDVIVNEAADNLQKGVDAGRLTEAQKNQILEQIRSHIDDIVNRTGPPKGEGGRPGFGSGGPPMGPPPWDNGGSNDNGGSSGNASFGPPAAGAWA